MLRNCEDIRNEGIDGVLLTTGRTPSSTAKWGLAANTDEALSVQLKMTLLVHPGLFHTSAKFGAIWTLRFAALTSPKRPLDDFREVVKPVPDGPHPVKTGANA